MRSLTAALLCTALSACALPQTTVTSGSLKPSLMVTGAPSDAVLYVDGLAMGQASQFDGHPRVLAVLQGPHLVEVREGSTVLYHDKVFLSNGETRDVKLLPVAAK
jgi:hypothetical protein